MWWPGCVKGGGQAVLSVVARLCLSVVARLS